MHMHVTHIMHGCTAQHYPRYISNSHYEAAEQKAAAQFARIVQEWGAKCNHPAPVNILSIPYWALYYCIFQWLSTNGIFYCIFHWCSTQSTRARSEWSSSTHPHERLSEHKDRRPVYARWRARSGDSGGQHTLSNLSYNAKLEELKDQIAGQLQSQFGDYEDNGTLIDKAVKVLNRRMEEKIEKMAQENITKIEEKIDKMEDKIAKGISQRLEELINSMPQKPTATEASARE